MCPATAVKRGMKKGVEEKVEIYNLLSFRHFLQKKKEKRGRGGFFCGSTKVKISLYVLVYCTVVIGHYYLEHQES